ncbi:MAG TPA: hypothetical protein VH280_18700 [Verrucomicrobiae bacterium]|jgi:hypothetical protein|nr:hypothetical protein [Verrucomicrobiae bacterium]
MSLDTYKHNPRNSSNRLSSGTGDPSIVLPQQEFPPIQFRAQRPANWIEDRVVISASNTPFRPFDKSSILSRRRYWRQIFLYGISSFAGGLPVANAAVVSWGYSSETLVNQIQPWAGTYGAGIQFPDGDLVDLSNIYIFGTADDAVFIGGI